ncbi:toprim domain-containing protein [Pseudomonas chlororaphis]|uniref:toprim domain-containing protein n=1 Tax=Pseudomonas chlororaphis TaxID=587753 RepID=UPI0012329C24|nr:toprim domain-containing protein [Pseudomonas chlororaphis]KAA5846516.1 toprim domain-containing protein [Pseudomonas chlororaphis]
MNKPSPLDLIRQTARHALTAAETLLPEWLPNGTRKGREWVAPNLARGDRQAGSFGVSLDSGKWNDFADSSAHGGDLVSLLAYLRNCRQLESAKEIDERLRLGLFDLTTADVQQFQQRRLQTEQERMVSTLRAQQLQEEKHLDTARQAAQLWKMAKPAERLHTYLLAKGLQPHQLRQLSHGRLLVPLCHDGRLVNLQTIMPDGGKRFLSGGRVQGCYSPLGKISEGCRLYVCEGWATGATLHHNTGSPVVCAMNAGNLKPVAMAMRERYGETLELVIAGDDDRETLGNPGRVAANHAAHATDALVVFPDWPQGTPTDLSDFNDLYLWLSGQYRESRKP